MNREQRAILQQFLNNEPSTSGFICGDIRCIAWPMCAYYNEDVTTVFKLLNISPSKHIYSCMGLTLQDYYKENTDSKLLNTAYQLLSVKSILNKITQK